MWQEVNTLIELILSPTLFVFYEVKLMQRSSYKLRDDKYKIS